MPPAIIERFQVIDGKVAVEDLSGKEPIREEFGLISFTLENLSTLKGRKGEYRFKGTSSSGKRYEANGRLNARLENGAFKLKDFELVEKGKKKVLTALPLFSVKGIGADLQDREITVEQIHTADGRIQSSLSPEGSFELQGIFIRSSTESHSK